MQQIILIYQYSLLFIMQKIQAQVKPTSDTLQQQITATIWRDLKSIFNKLKYIIIPKFNFEPNDQAIKQLRNWDLWGPLLLCLLLSITLNVGVKSDAKSFGMLFLIMWGGAFVVTINCKLLGGNVSFFQCVCVLGYCAILALIFKLVGLNHLVIKIIIAIVTILWSTISSISFTAVIVQQQKKIIATYPILLFYLFIAWFVIFI